MLLERLQFRKGARVLYGEGKEVRNDLRADGTKKSQIGWKGRIVSNVTGKIHTELTIDDKYPLINPYTTEEQIEHLKNNNYEGNAQKLQETEIGREMLLNARRHYEESLQKSVSPFVKDDELQRQKLGLEKKANGGEAKSTVNKAGNYTKPGLRERIFKRIKAAASHGTGAGQWSARKAQALAKQYKAKGGGYK